MLAVFKYLDHDGFYVPDTKGLEVLLMAWRSSVRGLNLLCIATHA